MAGGVLRAVVRPLQDARARVGVGGLRAEGQGQAGRARRDGQHGHRRPLRGEGSHERADDNARHNVTGDT